MDSGFDPEHVVKNVKGSNFILDFLKTIVKSLVYIVLFIMIIALLIKLKSNFFLNTEETIPVSKNINERAKELDEATMLELDFVKEMDQHKYYEKKIHDLEAANREYAEKIKEAEEEKSRLLSNIPKSRRRVVPEEIPASNDDDIVTEVDDE